MNMQDKDMDELFRSKLSDAEVQPSERVWKGIVVELDGVKQKSSLMPVIRIAASITVLVAAGLFFLLKDGNTSQYQANNNSRKKQGTGLQITQPKAKVAGAETTNTEQQPVQIAEVAKSKSANTALSAGSSTSIARVNTKLVVKHKPAVPDQHEVIAKVEPQPIVTEPQQALAAITNKHIEVTQPVVPDQPLTEPAKSNVVESNGFTAAQNKVVTAQLPPINKTNKPAKKHGIRNLGDLINVVVAKVDKRQDKLIEFSDTDDDESTVSGINLGIIKVKKDK